MKELPRFHDKIRRSRIMQTMYTIVEIEVFTHVPAHLLKAIVEELEND